MIEARPLAEGSRVTLVSGRHLTLGRALNRGGAGCIYLVAQDKKSVVKIYHNASELPAYQRKVEAMLKLSPRLPDLDHQGQRMAQLAWPSAVVADAGGLFRGFVMPKLDTKKTIELEYMLQERQAREAGLPGGLGARVTLAANLSMLVEALHQREHYVVDLKPTNARFHRGSLHVSLLDCDGFSIRGERERFMASQYTPDYLAPEFHSQGIATEGEQQQDHFALAVVVFRLLNFGVHPFTGRPVHADVPNDLPGRIAKRFYPYGVQKHKGIHPHAMSGHQHMPRQLRGLFDRAFLGPERERPTPAEWSAALAPLAKRSGAALLVCSKDRRHQHFAGAPCTACMRTALLAREPTKASAGGRPRAQTRRTANPTGNRVLIPSTTSATISAHRAWAAANKRSFPLGSVIGCFLISSMVITLYLTRSDGPLRPDRSTQISLPEPTLQNAPVAAQEPSEAELALVIDAVLGAAAKGDRGSYDQNMLKLHSDPEAQASVQEGADFLTHEMQRQLETLRRRPFAGMSVGEADDLRTRMQADSEHILRVAPAHGYGWYVRALSCIDQTDTDCAVGGFAIASLLQRIDKEYSLLDKALAGYLSGARLERMLVLRARGAMAARGLGGAVRDGDTQALAAQLLPEEVDESPQSSPAEGSDKTITDADWRVSRPALPVQ